MAASKTKILTVRMQESAVVVEYGTAEIEKAIPAGEGLVRVHAVFDGEKLTDVEVVTQKI